MHYTFVVNDTRYSAGQDVFAMPNTAYQTTCGCGELVVCVGGVFVCVCVCDDIFVVDTHRVRGELNTPTT